ncbi:hypothetical protein H2P26_004539 [Salmonella enterica]|nr:hypothetical protein [Salmonella enterica]EGA4933799.1 hypothetical protein [Salmonella enterica]EGX8402336.1 hypothetical protein [Salmonella enterica]
MKQMSLIEMDGFLKGKCIPRDLKVNETNAEYLVRKFDEAEAKISALATENVGLNNFIAASCFVYAGELGYWPAIDHSPEIPATNQLSIAESQFLTDVMTAAGLLSCGKRDKQLAQRLADFCVSKREVLIPPNCRQGGNQ